MPSEMMDPVIAESDINDFEITSEALKNRSGSIQILQSIKGRIKPVRSSPLYIVGSLFVSLVMVLLPLLYLAFIGSFIYLGYWHATANFHLVAETASPSIRFAFYLRVLYIAPLIAIAISVFFLFKPFFAKPGRIYGSIDVSPDDEPLLYDFVEKIAQAVRAPVPSKIEIDAQVNAGAGMEGGIFRRKFTLSIGLPLAVGLSAQELAGVIAHELGHFSQSIAMRQTRIIATINGWFERVVYERDQWDEYIDRQFKENENLVGIIFGLVKLMVWLSRKVLWVFMWVGHAVSCFFSRQMEYAADQYQIRLAGSEAFNTAHRKMHYLFPAFNKAMNDLYRSMKEGRLCDDLPGLIGHYCSEMPSEFKMQIEEELQNEKTHVFSTHPTHALRIRRADIADENGLIELIVPAKRLFKRYKDLARLASLAQYHHLFGPAVHNAELESFEEISRSQSTQREVQIAGLNYFGGGWDAYYPLHLGITALEEPRNFNPIAQLLAEKRKRVLADQESVAAVFRERAHLEDARSKVRKALVVLQTCSSISSRQKRKQAEKIQEFESGYRDIESEMMSQVKGLERASEPVRERIILALQLLFNKKIRNTLGDKCPNIDDVNIWLLALDDWHRCTRHMESASDHMLGLDWMIETQDDFSEEPKFKRKMDRKVRECGAALAEIQRILSNTEYIRTDGQRGIASEKIFGKFIPSGNLQTVVRAREFQGEFYNFYYLAIGQLTQWAELVEEVIGLKSRHADSENPERNLNS